MGAQGGRPGEMVWSVAGDGGFQMTMSELATMVETRIPVKFAIINNSYLGMVRRWQDLFYQKDRYATSLGRTLDFVKLADAFGCLGLRVTRKEEVAPAIEEANAYDGPAIVDFHVKPDENVYPMIPAGQSLAELIEEPREEEARQ